MSVSINQEKVLETARSMGIDSINQLAKFSKIDRNTLTAYLKSKKSLLKEPILRLAETLQLDLTEIIQLESADTSAQSRVCETIRRLVLDEKDVTVLLFGSRSSKKARKWSDVDIGLTKGLTPFDDLDFLRLYGKIKEACDDLPWKVDVVNLDAAPSWFLQGITSRPKLLLGPEKNYIYFLGKLDGAQESREG